MTDIVTTDWLKEHLNDEQLIVLDASMKSVAREHDVSNTTIPNARFFDLKELFSDKQSPFPNTLPSKEQFELECRKLGIGRSSKIVVFDDQGIHSSPRVWWMFKVMGHEAVSVLDGGLPQWIQNGYPVEERRHSNYAVGDFQADFRSEFVKNHNDILGNIDSHSFTVIDARSAGRFLGTEAEPRKHLKSGHIPHSINIHYKSVLDNFKFKSKTELQRIFDRICSDKKELVFSCGSGVTACIVMLASRIAGRKGIHLYDGSWSEWAEIQNLKIST